MPKHGFQFQPDVRDAVRRHVAAAVASVDPKRYRQEHAYSTALAHALEGVAYSGPYGRVEFRSTVVDDRGRGAAEKWSGADLAITAKVSEGGQQVNKAILVQAKRGELSKLGPGEKKRAEEQVDKMKKLTNAPKLMDIPGDGTSPEPGIYSGTVYRAGGTPRRYGLGDYFVNRVLTTLDGDTRPSFVDSVQDSGLVQLKVLAEQRQGRP